MNPKVVEVAKTSEPSRVRVRRVDAFVVSSDDAFLLELGPILGDRFRARPVEKIEDLDSPDEARWLALIDGGQAGARALANQIEKRYPRAPLIVVTPEDQQVQWNGALARGTVSAVVPHSQLRGAALQDALAMAERRLEPMRDPASSTTTEALTLKRLPAIRIATYAAPAVLILAALGWYLLRDKTPATRVAPRAASTAAATVATPQAVNATTAQGDADAAPVPQRSVLELLSLARVAFRDQERLLPRADGSRRGDSALELYAEVLAQDANNDEARDGIRRLFSVARSRMQSDLSGGRLDEAQRMLAIFKSAGVDAESARSLEADIKAAQPKWYLAQTRRAITAGDLPAAEQSLTLLTTTGADRNTLQELRRTLDARKIDLQLASMGEEVHAAIGAGALLEPAATSARAKLIAMRQLNRTHAATVTAQREVQEALVSRARETLQAQQFDSAQRLIASAAEFGATPDITELRRRIQNESEQSVARAAPAVTITPPVTAAAVAAPTPEKPGYLIGRPTRPLSVAYPSKAAEQKMQGVVIVEFTLNADGRASEVSVVEATPAGTFNKSAIDAVSRGRFDASVLGPDKQPARARLKVTFKPN